MATRTRNRQSANCANPGTLLQQGEALRERGQYAAAEKYLLKALQLLEQALGKRHLHTANALNGLGVLYKYMGRFAEASRAYRRALRIVERAANTSPEPELVDFLATLYHNLGGLDHSRGRHARGEPLARRSVELRRSVRDADDPTIAADEAALAALLDGQGKYDEAEQLYLRALAVFERHFGPEHYEVCVNLNNLAALYQLRGEPRRAEPLYQRALAIKEKLLGPRHPDTAITLHNLAMLLQGLSMPAEADRHFRRALSIFRKKFPRQHPRLVAAEGNYEHFRRQQKRGHPSEPEALARKA